MSLWMCKKCRLVTNELSCHKCGGATYFIEKIETATEPATDAIYHHSDGTWRCRKCSKQIPASMVACSDCFPNTPTPPSILTEAASLIEGDRRAAYGSVNESFARVARTWTDILKTPVTPQQVALCMIALKLHREANSGKRDNRVDICGYAALLDQLYENQPA